MIDVKIKMPDGTPRRVRRKSPVQTKRGAESFERQVRNELLNPKAPAERKRRKVPTLNKFSKEFIASYAVANNKPSEVESKKLILKKHLIPNFGRKRLDEIGVRQIEKFKAQQLKLGLAKKTVNNQLTVLRKLLVEACERGDLDVVPRVKWLRAPRPKFDFLTFDEANRLIQAADDEWQSMITLALRTGLRHGELLALQWDNIDLVTGRIFVCQAIARGVLGTPKNHQSREVPLSDEAIEALKACNPGKDEWVFSDENGSPVKRQACREPLTKALEKAGLRKIGWHTMRHAFASHLVMRGVPLKIVQELLGHATLDMTLRYAHLSPDVKRDAVKLLDGASEGHHRGTKEKGNSN